MVAVAACVKKESLGSPFLHLQSGLSSKWKYPFGLLAACFHLYQRFRR